MLNILFTSIIFFIMLCITLIHIYWLKGGLWPGDGYQNLVDKVLGTGVKLPSPTMFIIVIIIFFMMTIFPVLVYFNINITSYEKETLLVFGVLFFIRSFYMFVPLISNKVTNEFQNLNTKIYAPLCLLLSLSYLYLYLN